MKQKESYFSNYFEQIDRNTVLVTLSLVISANVAFFLYNYFHWNEGFWSVVSVAAVITADLSNTINKMTARLLNNHRRSLRLFFCIFLFARPRHFNCVICMRHICC